LKKTVGGGCSLLEGKEAVRFAALREKKEERTLGHTRTKRSSEFKNIGEEEI